MGPGANPEALLGILCLVLGVVLAVVLIIAIFYLLTLQKALSRVSPRNRQMEPGLVWLMLIPCVNFIWQFMIAIKVPESLRNEFRDRGQDDGSDYGKSLALTQAILGIVSSFIGNGLGKVPDMEIIATGISGVMSLVGLVLFIMFWVKIANYSNQLAAMGDDRRDLDRRLAGYDDDDDDRYGPRGGGSSAKPSPDTFKEGDPGAYK